MKVGVLYVFQLRIITKNLKMELSKETYPGSPEKKDIQSVVSDIMQDETIVGKQAKKSPENPPEKKKRGRPRKNPKKEDEETTQKEVPVKKPRGRPRKVKDTPTETIQKQSQTETQTIQKQQIDPQTEIAPQKQQTEDPQTDFDPQNDDIIPFIQNFSSTHPLHKLPHKTIKYIIFLIQLFQNNPQLLSTLPKHTLHTLLHTIYSSPPPSHHTTHHHTKHHIYSSIHQGHTTDTNT